MTNRERVLASLCHEQPDKIPFNAGFTKRAHRNMAEFYGDPQFDRKIGNCFTVLDAAPEDAWRETPGDVWVDRFGVKWDRSVDKDIGMVVNQQVTATSVEQYAFPNFADSANYDHIRAVTSSRGDRYVVVVLGFSLFERAWTLAGMENLLMAMACDPPFAHRLLDRILEYNLEVIERVSACGVDAVQFGDDWGAQRGLIMGPDMWREYIGLRVARMYKAVKDAGRSVFIHSCGKVDELFPDLIEFGLDVFNPFQPEVIDVFDAKRKFGDRLCFFGGISTQRILPYATPQQTREHVKRLLDEVGRDGGLFAAPAHDIPPDAKPEN
ncbi:MAG TPA: uroporphyrinogen decarboxylase family protein, partial [Candidatus Bathyarchaeia archaeon]|nr:uroporphyrinogen decarboxylase family protein [Candidatus Bathyarchaeia archaeon]